jgi:hypothetical protein
MCSDRSRGWPVFKGQWPVLIWAVAGFRVFVLNADQSRARPAPGRLLHAQDDWGRSRSHRQNGDLLSA